MSYILEALKKSQKQRELGQVPRIEEHWLEQLPDTAHPHPWMVGSVMLAILALLLAVYAVVRSGAPTPSSNPAQRVVPIARVAVAPEPALVAETDGSGESVAASQDLAPANPMPSAGSAAIVAPAESGVQPTAALEDPANLSVQPNILVVPAPDPQGRPLPRGADEIRRAVLGDQMSYSVDSVSGLPAGDMPAADAVAPEPEVPEELKAEIEAFKREVGQSGSTVSGQRPERSSNSQRAAPKPAAKSGPATESRPSPPSPTPTRAPGKTAERRGASVQAVEPAPLPDEPSLKGPSSGLRAKLPAYTLSVHVYQPDPAKRFVYINGQKFVEGERTPDGLGVEAITQAGIILSFAGERFFQRP